MAPAGLVALPPSYGPTRDALQQVAVHVLARRRHQLAGRFGLRATPGGIGTPAAGPDAEVVRIAGTRLLRERTGSTSSVAGLDLAGATLAAAAELAEVDLLAAFSVGHDTPPVGDPAAPLAIADDGAAALAAWSALGWAVLDAVTGAVAVESPTSIQLWPEHFDAGCDVGVGGRRVNLGASPGDGFSAEPYLYIGPWEPDRPGDPAFWNAPFGAVVGYEELRRSPDPLGAGLGFLRRGIELLATPS
jgi:hypothetical protein